VTGAIIRRAQRCEWIRRHRHFNRDDVTAALAYTIETAPAKAMQHTFYARQTDSVGVQMQIAEAALKIETAGLHV